MAGLRIVIAILLCSISILLGTLGFTAHDRDKKIDSMDPHGWTPRSVDTSLLAPSLRRPIIATFRWIASFASSPGPDQLIARRSAAGSSEAGGVIPMLSPIVSDAIAATVSPPVRDLPDANEFSAWVQRPEEGELTNRTTPPPANPLESDPVIQRSAPTAGMPPVGASFEGMNIGQACGTCLPPDTNGAVGPNHYVQMVNSSFAVYTKTGATLAGPKNINILWMLTPNSECATHNNGDPIVIYDQLADRWLISQFVVQNSTENYAQCVAISQTPDPTGAYWLYEFDESADTFHDYPHIGVWPDGYYISTNLFPNSALLTSTGAGAWAFERNKMLQGQPAKYVYFDETPLATNTYTPGGQLPSSLDGKALPPAGSPNYFVEGNDANQPNTPPAVGLHDEMHVWKFHVDWTNPANSTFGIGSSGPVAKPGFPGQYAGNAGQPDFVIPIADFLQSGCQIENGPNDCSPQKVNPPQPAQYLDVLGDRLMHRVTYRNFGDHESLVVSHTVDAQADQPTGVTRNGVRWYEVREIGATPVIYQQGTFAPFDPTSLNGPLWRWMGSAAMDHSGDLAIGYSASGPNYFPSLHYAGRLASDPLNELTQGEAVLFAGQGIEVNTGIFPYRNRWGDYSALSVDPTDDCTFWYTNEYLAPNSPTDIFPVDWHTRIGSFRFPQCVSPVLQLVSTSSRKVHGNAGPFDIPLPQTGARGVECRSGGANGDYTVVFTFANPVTTCGTSSAGTVHAGATPNECAVDLTGIANGDYVTVGLSGIVDNQGNTGNASATMGILLGDTTPNGVVSNTDVASVKSQVATAVTASNFRNDVNTNGIISNTDVSTTKAQVGTQLPSTP